MYHVMFFLYLLVFGCGTCAVVVLAWHLHKYHLPFLTWYLVFLVVYNLHLLSNILYTYVLVNLNLVDATTFCTGIDIPFFLVAYVAGAAGTYGFVKASVSIYRKPSLPLFHTIHLTFWSVLILLLIATIIFTEGASRLSHGIWLDRVKTFYTTALMTGTSVLLLVRAYKEPAGGTRKAAYLFGSFHFCRMVPGILALTVTYLRLVTIDFFTFSYLLTAGMLNIGSVLLVPIVVNLIMFNKLSFEPGLEVESSLHDRYALSTREQEVLRLVCQGLDNRRIGEELFIAHQTVKDHVHSIFRKTGVKNRVQLANLVKNLR